MDRVRHELERPAGQTLPAGLGQFRGGVQQQGERCGSGHSSASLAHRLRR